jgi:hypothetical protein
MRLLAQRNPRLSGYSARLSAVVVVVVVILVTTSGLSACGARCPTGFIETGGTCHLKPAPSADAGISDSAQGANSLETGGAAGASLTSRSVGFGGTLTAGRSAGGAQAGGAQSGATGGAGGMRRDGNGTGATVGGGMNAAGASSNDPCSAAKPSSTSDDCCPSGGNATIDPDCRPICGNGTVEMGETCDPASATSCPTVESCKSMDVCLVPQVSGDPSSCTSKCDLAPITMCKSGDGCCPMGCTYASDADCSQSCGDGVVSGLEICEPMSTTHPCPGTCDDGNACTSDVKTGTAEQCNVTCSHSPIAAAASGDGCCPVGADANNDTDCTPSCGNGVIEAGETCDGSCPTTCYDGNACTSDAPMGSAQACTAYCPFSSIVLCKNGDGCCAPGCTNSNDDDCATPPPMCGDGHVDSGETCDGNCPTTCPDVADLCTGQTLNGIGCNVACVPTKVSYCGQYTACQTNADCDTVKGYNCSGLGVCIWRDTCNDASTCPQVAGLTSACAAGYCTAGCVTSQDCPPHTECTSVSTDGLFCRGSSI